MSRQRVTVDGKFFRLGEERFAFRGVTYGTFKPRVSDGARFPERDRIKRDMAAMREAGFTVVRTYTMPPDDLVELAADWGLHLVAGLFYPDWRYLVGLSRRQRSKVEAAAHQEVKAGATRLTGSDSILGVTLGNEVPADVVRWLGVDAVAGTVARLLETVRSVDPEQLVSYANYPTAEYLPLEGLDFLTFNVFLERRADFRRYLTRLHHLAGDRPLVLGEVGLHAADESPEAEKQQAEALDWQLETAIERGVAGTCVYSWTDEWWVGDTAVEGWHFGLTRVDRSSRPSLRVAEKWNRRDVRSLNVEWPSISVVICAYNAADTLDECLQHTCALDYPGLDIVVVDDGSTDDTAAIVARHPRARVVPIRHAGLAAARNAGIEAARGDLIAYLDSDAFPSPEWPYYLALGMDGPTLGGVGGPNVPPLDDGVPAHQVARAPGGPLHVLLSDDRAEHVPGCNMAFWKDVLSEVGGFDPVYTAAGDDVDLCWRVLDRGWDIGFHPAALVWHHRRAGLRSYLRQQRGYGRSEALLEARHPDRFTVAGSARWRGFIYDSFPLPMRPQRVYRGVYGSAAYQSVYRHGGYALDLAHQIGIPVAGLLLLTAPAGLLWSWLFTPAVVAAAWILALGAIDVARTRPPRWLRSPRLGFGLGVATMHLLQPIVRAWGRRRHREVARRELPEAGSIPSPVHRCARGVLLLPDTAGRVELAAAIVTMLRRSGLRIVSASGWEDYDARILGSLLIRGDLVTSAHPEGSVQLRVRRRPRWRALGLLAPILALIGVFDGWVALVLLGAVALDALAGMWRTGGHVRRLIVATAAPEPP
ncbi:MAG: glycosyltransferase [Acidimicrobiaceae bacterium]|nr:glycosyltransferase [Acidimicrobiaceae bacterium]